MPETPVFPHLVHLNLGRPVAFLAWKGLERYRFDDCGFNNPQKKWLPYGNSTYPWKITIDYS
jgi:hypothetical protein